MNFQTPRGTKDCGPEEMVKKQYILQTIQNAFERYGFNPMDTPAFESWELLSSKSSGEEIKKEIYYFRDKSKRELGLRFDVTVPLARFVSNNPQLPKPFKRYQIGKSWRYDRPQAGRFREFLQADIDVIGSSSMACEAECLAVVSLVLKELGQSGFEIRVNNRKVLAGLMSKLDIKTGAIFRIIDKIDRTGKETAKKEMAKIIGDKTPKVFNFMDIQGNPKGVLEKARKELKGITIAEEGLKELEEMIELSKLYKIIPSITIDFSLVRGLDYYTGPIFEFRLKDFTGSIAGGGRYDNLIESFGGSSTPAAGISIGVDRLYEAIKEDLDIPTTTYVFVASVDSKIRGDAIRIGEILRRSGVNAQVDLSGKNLKKQISYANSAKIPYVIFVGSKEIKSRKFTLRNMNTGKEIKANINDIIVKLTKENSKI